MRRRGRSRPACRRPARGAFRRRAASPVHPPQCPVRRAPLPRPSTRQGGAAPRHPRPALHPLEHRPARPASLPSLRQEDWRENFGHKTRVVRKALLGHPDLPAPQRTRANARPAPHHNHTTLRPSRTRCAPTHHPGTRRRCATSADPTRDSRWRSADAHSHETARDAPATALSPARPRTSRAHARSPCAQWPEGAS